MRKTRDLFKKIRDTKGTFQAKMSSIKDRNGRDQTEAEISRRGGQNSQKNYTQNNYTSQPDNNEGVIVISLVCF